MKNNIIYDNITPMKTGMEDEQMLLEESYLEEKEARERRLAVYAEEIQKYTLERSKQIIEELVAERHRQNLTQQEISNRTGIMPSNLARFESGTRIPTLLVLQKYAAALGKYIEIKICDDRE